MMRILELPYVLGWTGAADISVEIYGDYQKHMMLVWGAALMRILQADRQVGLSLADKARCLPPDAFRRFLTAPEVVCCINGHNAVEERTDSIAKFFGDALDAEH